MNIIRPIHTSDFKALYEIAEESGVGFTSLPVNDNLLAKKITRSEASLLKRSAARQMKAICLSCKTARLKQWLALVVLKLA